MFRSLGSSYERSISHLTQPRARGVTALEADLVQGELDLATTHGELQNFEREYQQIIGTRYAELERIEIQIAEYMAYLESNRDFNPSEDIKQVYRQVAKLIHPDLTTDPQQKIVRQQLMTEANKRKIGDYQGAAEDYKQGMVAEIDDCNRMIALNSNDRYAYFQRARAKCSLGDYQGATEDRKKGRTLEIDNYNQMIAINPNPNSSDDFLKRAEYKKYTGDYQGAHNDYNQAILLNSNDHSIYTIRAEFREEIRDYQGAVDDYNQVNLLKPKDSSSVYCNRVRILNIQKDIRNHQGIVDIYNQLILQKPDLMGDYFYCDRAEAKYELGDYLGTIEDCTQSIKSEHNIFRSYFFRVSAREKLGDYQEAIDDCDLAIYRYQNKSKDQYFQRLLNLRNQLVQ